MTEQPPQIKARRGCLFYGCLGGLIILLLVVIGGLIGLHYAKKMFSDFTDPQPIPLPAVRLSQPEIEQLRRQVDAFRESVRAGRQTSPLTLTADDINALIATDPDLQPLKGKFYVTLENDHIKGQLSVSMQELGLPIFRDRYLNGSGTFSLSLRNGLLRLTAEDITVKGKPLPSPYMDSIRKENLARNINNNPRDSVALDRLQSIEVKDSKLIIVPKGSP